jgi:hypothetical protein
MKASWLLGIILAGCASLPNQKLNPAVFYKRDVQLNINGENFVGVGVPAKDATGYKIKLKAAGKIDLLTITSCHRELTFEKPSQGWFKDGRSFEYFYKPIPGVEDGRGCLLDIGAYEQGKGRHSWATIDFEDGFEQLPAILSCSGERKAVGPVSICQAKSGLFQTIEFKEKVKVAPSDECNVLKTKDELTYEFEMPTGECTFYFGTKSKKYHRLTTHGYEEILIREGGTQ